MKFLRLRALFPPLFFSESKLGLREMMWGYAFGIFSMRWYIVGLHRNMPRHVATLWCNVASVEKYRSPRRKINPVGTWYFTSAHNCIPILIINYLARTRSIASLPCKIVWEIWCGFLPRNRVIIRGFSPWTASGFLCFCFDSIHDSATMHNLSPRIFYWTAMLHPFSSE